MQKIIKKIQENKEDVKFEQKIKEINENSQNLLIEY